MLHPRSSALTAGRLPPWSLVLDARRPCAAPAPRAAPGFWAWTVAMARTVHPGRSADARLQRARLLAAQFAHRRALRRWLDAGAAPLHEMLAWRPSLVTVVRRPYISVAWNGSRRVAAVEAHYRALAGRGAALRGRPGEARRLAVVAARGAAVELVLDAPAWFVHEGELCLSLFEGGERIYTLAFSLGVDADDGAPVAFVGALQGLGSDRALPLYRALTGAFFGLRPRDLLIAAFRTVCRSLGLARWLAVGDACRVSASAYFDSAPAVRTRYDLAWAEHGGELRADGFHRMPVELARRPPEATPQRKRNAYRQRYELLDRLDRELGNALADRGAA